MVNTCANDSIQSLTTGVVFTLKQETMWVTIIALDVPQDADSTGCYRTQKSIVACVWL